MKIRRKSHPRLARIRRYVRRFLDVVPPTWRGTILAALAAAALGVWGFGTLDLVLYVIGIAGLVLLAVASLMVGGTALYLRRRLRAPAADDAAPRGGLRRTHVSPPGDGAAPASPPQNLSSVPLRGNLEAGSLVPTGWNVPALTWLPLVKLRWEWVEPGDIEVRVRPVEEILREEIVARHRGQAGNVRRRVAIEDAFGLARVAWVHVDQAPVTILPHRGRLRDMPLVRSMTSAEGIPHPSGSPEGDRMEIRRYQPGDSMRHIMWKTYARTRQLNVRMPERAIERSRKTIAYLLAGPDDEPAAAAARVALERGVLGDEWIFGADGTAEATDSLGPALKAIARSGSVSVNGNDGVGNGGGGDPRHGLADFLREVGSQGETHCIVFASARPGAWTREVLEAARTYPGAMSFVVGIDGLLRDVSRSLWRRLLWAEERPEGIALEDLATLLRQLSSAGCPALVVDRKSGRSYSPAQQQALGASG